MPGSADGEIALPVAAGRRRRPAGLGLPRLGAFPQRAAWPVALATAAVAIALGAPLVALAAVGDELRHPEIAAVLRGAWIGLYAVIGLYLARRAAHWPLGLAMTTVALVTAIASVDAVPGQAAYTVSRIVTIANVPLLVLMLVAIPEARGARGRLTGLTVLAIPVALALAVGYLTLAPTAPWSYVASQCRGSCAGSAIQVADSPVAARVVLALLAAVLVATLAALVAILVRALRSATPVARRTLRPITWLAVVWSVPVGVGFVVMALAPTPDRLNPYLVVSGVIRAGLPVAVLTVVVAQAVRTSAIRDQVMARLAVAKNPADVERTIAEALRDPSLRLAFRDGAGWMDVEGRPLTVDTPADGRGWIAMSLPGAEAAAGAVTFDPALHTQEERIQAVATLGAAALERARAEAELQAVRRRLVSVAEDERRRVERSLHDGAQQRLIAMAVRLSMARETLADRPESALGLLQNLGADVQQALDEMRALSRGLYPPVLVDHGLPEALRSAARHAPVPVDTAIAEIGRLDPLHEAAVYFCCAEALQNAVKHGGPEPDVSMGLSREDGVVRFEVADTGPGFVVGRLAPGSGLIGMRDRVEGVGGTLVIDSAPGRGTRVSGWVPAGPAVADAGLATP